LLGIRLVTALRAVPAPGSSLENALDIVVPGDPAAAGLSARTRRPTGPAQEAEPYRNAALMAKLPTPESIAAGLTVSERVLLFWVGSDFFLLAENSGAGSGRLNG
jgi:hypothetical protein